MDLRSILTHPQFYLHDEEGRLIRSHFFRRPLSYNDPCWVNSYKDGIIWTKDWHGETKTLELRVRNLQADDWFFCDENGNLIELEAGLNEI